MGETGIDGTHFCPRSTYGRPATANATSEHLPAAVKRIGCLQKGLGGPSQVHLLHPILNMQNAHGHPARHVGYSLLATGKIRASHFKSPGLTPVTIPGGTFASSAPSSRGGDAARHGRESSNSMAGGQDASSRNRGASWQASASSSEKNGDDQNTTLSHVTV